MSSRFEFVDLIFVAVPVNPLQALVTTKLRNQTLYMLLMFSRYA